MNVKKIKAELQKAADTRCKASMFQLQVLLNIDAIMAKDNPKQFCADVGMPPSYTQEVQSMIKLHSVMTNERLILVRVPESLVQPAKQEPVKTKGKK